MSANAVGDALHRFFAPLESVADDDLPMLPIPDGARPGMFVGDAGSDGWIRWRPSLKDEVFDLSQLEKNATIQIHPSIKGLLNPGGSVV